MNSAAYPLSLDHKDGVASTKPLVRCTENPTLLELMEDGIYLLFLLREGNFPQGFLGFNENVDRFLETFSRVCATFNKPRAQVEDARYAFCALLDEIVLAPGSPLREEWAQNPLQLRLFGEHLAGEGFFHRLERLRGDVKENLEVVELFHTCLLLGFRGKYLLEGEGPLATLTARVAAELQAFRGRSAGLAPHWKLPFRVSEYVTRIMPVWLFAALIVAVCLGVYLSFNQLLERNLSEFPQPGPLPAGVIVGKSN